MTLDVQLSKEIIEKAYQAVETSRKTGKIKKGINEVTKAIERETAKLVLVAQDVSPKEIVMHLPMLAEEHNIALVAVPSPTELGAVAGLPVGTGAIAVLKEGDAKKDIDALVKKLKENGSKE